MRHSTKIKYVILWGQYLTFFFQHQSVVANSLKKGNQFTMIENWEKQQILKFKKLEVSNVQLIFNLLINKTKFLFH